MLPESIREIEQSKNALLTSDVLDAFVAPGGTALVVGPGARVHNDATSACIALRLGHKGSLIFADPFETDLGPYNNASINFRDVGYGNITRHMSDLSDLAAMGFDIAPPRWLGPDSGIKNYCGVADRSVPFIYDHGTLAYVVGDMYDKNGWDGQLEALSGSFAETYRALKDDGTYILQLSTQRYGYATALFGGRSDPDHIRFIPELLEQAGFIYTYLHVTDVVSLRMNEWQMTSILNWKPSYPSRWKDMTLGGTFSIIHKGGGTYDVQFDPETTGYRKKHTSPDMFICRKTQK